MGQHKHNPTAIAAAKGELPPKKKPMGTAESREWVYTWIREHTLLPIMGREIRRNAAIAYIREQSEECQKAFEEFGGESGIYADVYNDLAEDFYSIPAADVAPVVHGLWEREPSSSWRWTPSGAVAVTRTTYRCGLCGRGTAVKSNYCPNCGAKMDGGESDEGD